MKKGSIQYNKYDLYEYLVAKLSQRPKSMGLINMILAFLETSKWKIYFLQRGSFLNLFAFCFLKVYRYLFIHYTHCGTAIWICCASNGILIFITTNVKGRMIRFCGRYSFFYIEKGKIINRNTIASDPVLAFWMCLGRRAILAQKSISYFVFDEGLKLVVRETFQK